MFHTKYNRGEISVVIQKNDEWGNVRISKELLSEIDKLFESKKYQKLHFSGKSAFVSYLIRKEIKENS
jgi:metal-responsive CopG/Arc/MetJ family transcriptional regulator